jgi:general secretion pathway protein M
MIRRLSKREIWFLLGGGGVLLLLLAGASLPSLQTQAGYAQRIEQKQLEVEQARQVQQQLRQVAAGVRERQAKLAQHETGSAFALVEATTLRLGCRDNLAAIRPQSPTSREGVRVEPLELRFENISLEQLTRLLEAFEGAEMLLNVRSLKVRRRFNDPAGLDAVLTLEALQREG